MCYWYHPVKTTVKERFSICAVMGAAYAKRSSVCYAWNWEGFYSIWVSVTGRDVVCISSADQMRAQCLCLVWATLWWLLLSILYPLLHSDREPVQEVWWDTASLSPLSPLTYPPSNPALLHLFGWLHPNPPPPHTEWLYPTQSLCVGSILLKKLRDGSHMTLMVRSFLVLLDVWAWSWEWLADVWKDDLTTPVFHGSARGAFSEWAIGEVLVFRPFANTSTWKCLISDQSVEPLVWKPDMVLYVFLSGCQYNKLWWV